MGKSKKHTRNINRNRQTPPGEVSIDPKTVREVDSGDEEDSYSSSQSSSSSPSSSFGRRRRKHSPPEPPRRNRRSSSFSDSDYNPDRRKNRRPPILSPRKKSKNHSNDSQDSWDEILNSDLDSDDNKFNSNFSNINPYASEKARKKRISKNPNRSTIRRDDSVAVGAQGSFDRDNFFNYVDQKLKDGAFAEVKTKDENGILTASTTRDLEQIFDPNKKNAAIVELTFPSHSDAAASKIHCNLTTEEYKYIPANGNSDFDELKTSIELLHKSGYDSLDVDNRITNLSKLIQIGERTVSTGAAIKAIAESYNMTVLGINDIHNSDDMMATCKNFLESQNNTAEPAAAKLTFRQ